VQENNINAKLIFFLKKKEKEEKKKGKGRREAKKTIIEPMTNHTFTQLIRLSYYPIK
jgi:hypothetical protein